jgi:hypothetical protein
MITAEIAGYTLAGNNVCSDCVRDWAEHQLRRESHRFGFGTTTLEDLLNALAGLWDVDREYADSEDFPVPFSYQTAQADVDSAVHYGEPTPHCNCGNDFTGEF